MFKRTRIMWVSVITSKTPKVQFLDQARASIFSCQNLISSKIVVQILFAEESVFPKHLGSLLAELLLQQVFVREKSTAQI